MMTITDDASTQFENPWQLMAEYSRDMICLHDPDGTYRYISPAVTRLLGYTPDELLGTDPYALFHEEDQTRIRVQSHNAALTTQQPTLVTYRARRKDGSYIWFETTTQAITQAGQITGLVTTSRDVSDRLNEQSELYHYLSVVMGSRDLISVIDHDYVYRTVNDQYLLYHDKERNDIVGRSIEELHGTEVFEGIIKPQLDRCFKGATIEYKDWFTFVGRGRRYVEVLYYPAADPANETIGAVVQVRDITDMQQAERQRERLFNSSLDLHCVATTDGYFQQVNKSWERLLGWTEDELKSRPFIEFVHPDDIESTINATMDLSKGGRIPRFQNRYQCKDGSYRHLIWDSTADPVEGLIYATAHDESELMAAKIALEERNAALESANEELQRFAYVASHDLQEPLRMVTSYLQLLEKRYRDQLDDRANTYIDFAVDGARRMKELINDLLSYSRITSLGKAFEPTDLSKVLTEIVQHTLRYQVVKQEAEIIIDPLPTIEADESQMRQLFQNLVSNALKYAKPDETPMLHVMADTDDDETVTITVVDNGIGIEDQYFERIFTIFQRLHTRDEYEGTGIGLAICRRIVERHRGTMSVTSEVGEGSRFSVTLPRKNRQLEVDSDGFDTDFAGRR